MFRWNILLGLNIYKIIEWYDLLVDFQMQIIYNDIMRSVG